MTHSGSNEAQQQEKNIAALEQTVESLKRRVKELQNRPDRGLGVFESMAHLESLVAQRTEELAKAKQQVEQIVLDRTSELRQKAEELERANQMLREMDRMKTHLLQNVSHELKTPLVSIRGYAELLRARYGKNLSTEQLEFLQIIVRNADHLNRVVEDLLQASQAVKGISPFDRGLFEVNALISEIIQEMQPFAETHGVHFYAEFDRSLVMLEGDRRQLRQMILNILSNAIKFCANSDVRRVSLTIKRRRKMLEIVIEDTGIGIPKDKIHRIFERFYQVDPSATRTYGGMGIGLALVQEVVENHDGIMSVESEHGHGTKFIVQLPLGASDSEMSGLESTSMPINEIDVVVVEDQPESALFYHTALEEQGLRIASFIRAQDALKKLQEMNPRVVLLDLSMPEMSGLKFLDHVDEMCRQGQLDTRPHIIMITARSQDEIDQMQVSDRVDKLLLKPFSLDALQTTLQPFLA